MAQHGGVRLSERSGRAVVLLHVGPADPARLDPQKPVVRAGFWSGEFLDLQPTVVDEDRRADHADHESPSFRMLIGFLETFWHSHAFSGTYSATRYP